MRLSFGIGLTAQVEVQVTEAMTATFEELGPVHPVYATWNLVRHMEEASRKVILTHLEPDEDAVGHAVSVTHTAPALVGETVTVTARVAGIDGRKIVCAVEAHGRRGMIGHGETVQMLVDRRRLAERLAALRSET